MPRDGKATRTRILDAAERLVEDNGFAATTVEAILEASTTSKGAFFHHFDSKRALARAMVTRFVDADLEMLRAGLDAVATEPDATAKVLGFLGHYETWAESLVAETSSCLYIALLVERDLLDDETRLEVERAVLAWREGFASLLKQTDIGPLQPDDLADHLFTTFEGAFLLCRTLDSADPMRAQLGVFRELLEALLGRSPGGGSRLRR